MLGLRVHVLKKGEKKEVYCVATGRHSKTCKNLLIRFCVFHELHLHFALNLKKKQKID